MQCQSNGYIFIVVFSKTMGFIFLVLYSLPNSKNNNMRVFSLFYTLSNSKNIPQVYQLIFNAHLFMQGSMHAVLMYNMGDPISAFPRTAFYGKNLLALCAFRYETLFEVWIPQVLFVKIWARKWIFISHPNQSIPLIENLLTTIRFPNQAGPRMVSLETR